MSHLFIRFVSPVVRTEDGLAARLDWLIRSDDGSVAASGRTDERGLSEIVDPQLGFNDPANVTAIVPAEHVLSVRCSVPGRNVSQIRRALPFAVEEFLTEDVETMHIANGGITRGEPVDCLVVPRDLIDGWRDLLLEHDLAPGLMTVDGAVLPVEGNEIAVLLEGDFALVRTADQMASIDHANLLPIVGDLIAMSDPDARAVVRIIDDQDVSLDFEGHGISPDQILREATAEGALAYLTDQLPGSAINLLQGEFTASRRTDGAILAWRPVFGLAAVWAVVAVIAMLVEGFWAQSQADALRSEAGELYKSIYGERRIPGNPSSTMRRREGQVDVTAASFVQLVGQFALGVKETIPGSKLSSVTYTEARESIAVDFTVASFDTLDALKTALESRGLKVDLGAAEQQGDVVRASVRVGVVQ